MPSRGWKQINFREDMINKVNEFINRVEVQERYGFESVPEFMRRATSSFMAQIERELTIGTDFMLSPEEHRKLDQEEKERKKDG